MKSLLEVSRLVTRQKLRRLDPLSADALEAPRSKIRELYDALQDGTVRNDREAARLLYEAELGDPRYRKLKSRFRKRLTATLLLVDQQRPHRRGFDHTLHSCQREWALVNILLDSEADEAALGAARALLTTCRRYGFASLTADCARLLADDAAAAGDARRAQHYDAISREALDRTREEAGSAAALRSLKLDPTQTSDPGGLAPELERGADPEASPSLRFDYLEARALLAERVRDLGGTCAAVEAMADYSTSGPRLLDRRRLLGLRFRQLRALVALGDQEGFASASQAALDLTEPGTASWHRLRRLFVAEALGRGDFASAAHAVASAQRHRSARHLSGPERKAWSLLGDLAVVLDPSADHALAGIGTEGTQLSRGYERLGAWWMIVDLCRLRRLGRREACSEAVNSLRAYTLKQLKRNGHPDLYAFAHYLTRRARADFGPASDRVADRYLRDLRAHRHGVRVSACDFSPLHPVVLVDLFGDPAPRTPAAEGH